VSDVAIRKKKSGRWEARWRDRTGRRRGRTVDLKKDADRFATEIRRQQQVGDLVGLERGTVVIADFVVDYWRDYAIPNLAARTRAVYGRVWEKHLRPRVGGLALRELTTPSLTRLRAELSRDGVGDPTVLKAFTMLQSVLSHAVVEGHLDHNPARAVRKPRQRRERKVDPVPPEVIEFMRADLLDRGDRASALLVCSARLRRLAHAQRDQRTGAPRHRDTGHARERAQDASHAHRGPPRAPGGGPSPVARRPW
jgi:hypothetical protein